tara:strand:+ start:222 stop:734 length:513 start_codon:yes stop_codon:yes gene_type:complete
MRVESDDEDELSHSIIEAATSHMDGKGDLGRAMITQTWTQWFGNSPGCPRLLMGPFQSVTAIDYYDADGVLQSADTAEFETWLDGDFVTIRPKRGFAWPAAENRADAIRVTYVAGYGDNPSDVPRGIRHALLMFAAHLYESRESASEAKLNKTPMGYDDLVCNHRVSWYG